MAEIIKTFYDSRSERVDDRYIAITDIYRLYDDGTYRVVSERYVAAEVRPCWKSIDAEDEVR